jgi:SRSO17 transposase
MAIPKTGLRPLDDLSAFLSPFASLVRRPESRHALERYTTGLLADLSRKTASEMGRAVAGTSGQRLQEFLTNTAWDPREMGQLRVQRMVRCASQGKGIQLVDDTGFAKKGDHSVGVARQYSGTLGRVDNCQVLVTTHYVDTTFDWPIAAQAYLPEGWTKDRARRKAARVPSSIRFQTKGEMALKLIDLGLAWGVPTRAVVADAGYGDQPPFLKGLEKRLLPYLVGVAASTRFRLAEEVERDPGDGPTPPYQGRGRPRKVPRLKDRLPSREARVLLEGLPGDAWRRIVWRDGTKGPLVKEFARLRVYRVGLRGTPLQIAGWLIGERPAEGHVGERKYYLAWGLDPLPLDELVELAHTRWVIERFYQDAKGELGLDDYEGRLWTGFHRHVALVMLAHCYLALRQSYGPSSTLPPPTGAFPPKGPSKRHRPTEGHP